MGAMHTLHPAALNRGAPHIGLTSLILNKHSHPGPCVHRLDEPVGLGIVVAVNARKAHRQRLTIVRHDGLKIGIEITF